MSIFCLVENFYLLFFTQGTINGLLSELYLGFELLGQLFYNERNTVLVCTFMKNRIISQQLFKYVPLASFIIFFAKFLSIVFIMFL